jgi:hypothetical protein
VRKDYLFAVLWWSMHHGKNVVGGLLNSIPYQHCCVKEQYAEE